MSALENVMVGRHLRERAGWLAAMLRSPRLARAERACREEARRADALRRPGRLLSAPRPTRCPTARSSAWRSRARSAAKPKLLLLDEPAAGLNQTETQAIDALIVRLAATRRHRGAGRAQHAPGDGRLGPHRWCSTTAASSPKARPSAVRNDPRVIEAYLGSAAAGRMLESQRRSTQPATGRIPALAGHRPAGGARASWWRWWAPTAPARPRCCARSPACSR